MSLELARVFIAIIMSAYDAEKGYTEQSRFHVFLGLLWAFVAGLLVSMAVGI